MPSKQPLSLHDLGMLAVDELERSVTYPSILNYQPWGGQEPFHKSTHLGRILSGGNQAGKTDALVCEFIWCASDTYPDWACGRPENWGHGAVQLRLICVDIQEGLEQILLPKFKRWMPRSMMVDGSWERSWDSNKLILTFANGSTIDFLTYKMDLQKFGGVQRHMIGFDEEPPLEIFNESMPRLHRFNGRWVISATPVKGIDWLYELLVEPVQRNEDSHKSVFFIELDARLNPHLQVEDRGAYNLAMTESERLTREQGKFMPKTGFVFPEFKPRFHVVPHHWPTRGCMIYSSTDHGVRNPTAWLWHAVSPNGRIFTFAEHYVTDQAIYEIAASVNRLESRWKMEQYGWFSGGVLRVGDPAMKQREGTSGMNPLQAYAQHGLYIGVEGIPKDPTIGIDKMHEYLSYEWEPESDRLIRPPMWTISDQCPNLIRELPKLQWAHYESDKVQFNNNFKEEVRKKNDHAFDSSRYFFTLRPNLRPQRNEFDSEGRRVTLTYGEALVDLTERGQQWNYRDPNFQVGYADEPEGEFL
jgi:phage terminase large subunit-like protein